ncbi:MAG TPA: hypothetical protein VGB87_02450, partial [Vicinamibacteria bacterium]
MTEDQLILRQAAAWIRGMADAGHEVLKHVRNAGDPIPIDREADSFVFLAGRPTECNPNPRLVNCFALSATAEGTVSVRDVGDVLARLS